MDHGSTPVAGMPHLLGVKKTLRRLYAPSLEPNEAIDGALAILARRERQAAGLARRPALLAPAA